MSKVYIVVHGRYDDYTIMGVFSSRKKADECINENSTKFSDYGIEEYEVDSLENKTTYGSLGGR